MKRNGGGASRPPKRPDLGRYIKSKGLAALQLYLGFSPLFLLPGAVLLPDYPAAALLLPIPAALLPAAAGLFAGKRRRAAFLLAILLEALLCAGVLLPLHTLSVLLFLPCLALMLLMMPATARAPYLEWPATPMAYGVALHLAGQAVKGQGAFSAMGGTLSLFFSAYLLLCLFASNRFALMDGAKSDQAPPAKLLQKNRLLLIFISLAALSAANIKALQTAALFVWDFIKRALATIIVWLSMLLPQLAPAGNQSAPQEGLDLGMLGEAQEPSAFSLFMEKVLAVLAVVVVGLLLLVGLYLLMRQIRKALKKILAGLRAYSRSIGEGYVDSTESLFDWGEVGRAAKGRWESFQKRHKKLPAWDSLSPGDRVRRVYALLIRRLRHADPSLTAREALVGGALELAETEAQKMAALYEQARYSDHPVSPEEAEAMRKSAGV